MKVFTDFHHSSLLRSLYLLFEDRLGMEVYRPIGMEWWDENLWAINDQVDTARQYLDPAGVTPPDGTPNLNHIRDYTKKIKDGVLLAADPGGKSFNRGMTLEKFKETKFDYLICSIVNHIEIFEYLIATYQPQAKLIFQAGNFNQDRFLPTGMNVLSSIKPRRMMEATRFNYHQEFELDIFKPTPTKPGPVTSMINLLQNTTGWADFEQLEKLTAYQGIKWRSFGGQCRDGALTGHQEVADAIAESMFIYHVKDYEGYGHNIYNAYAMGRPVIIRKSWLQNCLCNELFQPGTYIDLDAMSPGDAKNLIVRLSNQPDELENMGNLAAQAFKSVVDFEREAEGIREWLETL